MARQDRAAVASSNSKQVFSCAMDKSSTRDSCVSIRTITLNIEERKIESRILSVREIDTLRRVTAVKESTNKELGSRVYIYFPKRKREQLYLTQNFNREI